MGLNLKDYSIVTNHVQTENNTNINIKWQDKESDIYLASNEGKVRVLSFFINNSLHQLYMTEYEGNFSLRAPTNHTIDLAKSFLSSYQNYTKDTLYTTLASTLDNVKKVDNFTKSIGNIKLAILNSEDKNVQYIWTYIDDNGIEAHSKNIILSFNEGRLQGFLNNWPFYTIAGTPKFSSEEVTSIAIGASTKFSYDASIENVTSNISGFKIAPPIIR
jgi:hypothetical protein